MADFEGDKTKRPDSCDGTRSTCKNIKSISEDWESETYRCDVCGKKYTLYDDEMR